MTDKKLRIWNHEGNDYIDVLYHDNGDGTYSQVFINLDVLGNAHSGLTYAELILNPLQVLGPLTDAELRATGLEVIPVATEEHLGAVGGHTEWVKSIVSMSRHTSYISGDFVGTDGIPINFVDCSRIPGGSGTIIMAILIDHSLQSVPVELWLFDEPVTPPNDGEIWDISDADMDKCVGVIPFKDYYVSASNGVSQVDKLTIGFKTGSDDTTLFGCLVTDGVPVYAGDDITIRLCILKD